MPRLVLMEALLRFQAQEGSLRPGMRFTTYEPRAYRLETREPPLAKRLFAATWPIKGIGPLTYLTRFPEGRHIGLARKLVGAE